MKKTKTHILRYMALFFFIPVIGTGLVAEPSEPAITKIKAHSELDRELVAAERKNPLLQGYGRSIFLSEIRWAGAVTFEMSYEWLPGTDCISQWCFDSLIVYKTKDGRLERLNYCPTGYGKDRYFIDAKEKCVITFRKFIRKKGLKGHLDKESMGRMFVTLCCHRYEGDFPTILLTKSEVSAKKQKLSQDQKLCLDIIKRKGLLDSKRLFIVAMYAEELSKSFTNKPITQEWWNPWVFYQFSFTSGGEIESVTAVLLNRPQ